MRRWGKPRTWAPQTWKLKLTTCNRQLYRWVKAREAVLNSQHTARQDGPLSQERGDKCIRSWWDGPQALQEGMGFGFVQVARQTLPGYVPSWATTEDKGGLGKRCTRKGGETGEKKPHHQSGMQKGRHGRHSLRKSEENKVKGKIKRARWTCNLKEKKGRKGKRTKSVEILAREESVKQGLRSLLMQHQRQRRYINSGQPAVSHKENG